jgi:hypothetical protein
MATRINGPVHKYVGVEYQVDRTTLLQTCVCLHWFAYATCATQNLISGTVDWTALILTELQARPPNHRLKGYDPFDLSVMFSEDQKLQSLA